MDKIIKILERKLETIITPIEIANLSEDKLVVGLDKNEKVIHLRLCNIPLKEFPKEVFLLKDIERLEIINTKISFIPDKISKLQKLETLRIINCQIKELPRSIADLSRLNYVTFKDCPIKYPPPEIMSQGAKGIMSFLSSLSSDPKSLNEVKIILIGEGGSGKTSVLKRLTSGEFDLNEDKTHGIRIEHTYFRNRKTHYKINFWDFGGQEIMHSTHQFFLSKRSLYLLVLDGRKEEDPEYWLNHISTFGGNSPVLVILNKYDDNPSFDVNRKFLGEKYRNIKGFIKVSCRTQYQFSELRDTLYSEVQKIDHISTRWPKEWFDIKNQLETMEKDYISYESYEKICESHSLNEPSKRQSLIDFLHDLGVVLHFDEINLNETNVINPKWITKAVYSIINSALASQNLGIVTISDLSNLLNLKKYPRSKYGYIIGIMKKFELCYSIGDHAVLIPDLLDIQEPMVEFNYKGSLYFLFRYEFLPKSIVPRFIVKSNLEVQENTNWRSGIYLKDFDLSSEAVVKADYQKKIISINVTGDNRIELFSILRSRFNSIHNSFKRLNYEELVPCTCSECKNVQRPHYFDYSTLLKCKKVKRSFLPCPQSLIDMSVIELLKGIEMNVEEFSWNVFISYSSKDIEEVIELSKILKKNKITYWLDREQIKPGESISRKIENGLKNSSDIILCISENQIKSGWSRAEYTSVLNEIVNDKTKKRIIPLVFGELANFEIPALLRDLKYVEYNNKKELTALIESIK